MAVLLALIGPGLVGAEVLDQLQHIGVHGTGSRHPAVRVVAIANSRRMALANSCSTPLPLERRAELLSDDAASEERTRDHCVVDANLDALWTHLVEIKKDESNATVVIADCTSSDAIAAKYPHWLKKGAHIVTPNKKAFSGELGLWKEISKLTSKRPSPYPFCMHEATVGAGLPVISTLRDLTATGDSIVKIEGVLSGTLSFLFNQFSTASGGGAKFSEIVRAAKERGYTEPDPRDDLNGIDVARKVVILSRVSGIDLSLETLPVDNIVPGELRAVPSADEFMDRLSEFDAHFNQLNEAARLRGEVLRYVGVVSATPDKAGRSSQVALKSYPLTHPFAQLQGSDNMIAFYTKRFSPQPLIIQGSGAGAAVTAHGVLSDILKVAEITQYST